MKESHFQAKVLHNPPDKHWPLNMQRANLDEHTSASGPPKAGQAQVALAGVLCLP